MELTYVVNVVLLVTAMVLGTSRLLEEALLLLVRPLVVLLVRPLVPNDPSIPSWACGLNLRSANSLESVLVLILLNARLLTLTLRLMLCCSVPIPWPSPIRLTPLCSDLFPPLFTLLVRLTTFLSLLHRPTYPVVNLLLMLGMLGTPLVALLCNVVRLGHRVGLIRHPLLIVRGATRPRLPKRRLGHSMAMCLLTSRKVLWLLDSISALHLDCLFTVVSAVTTLLFLHFRPLMQAMFSVASTPRTSGSRASRLLGVVLWAFPHRGSTLPWKALFPTLNVIVRRLGPLSLSIRDSTAVKFYIVPAVRLVRASKPLVGKVKNVWNVSERLLIISNALCAPARVLLCDLSTFSSLMVRDCYIR